MIEFSFYEFYESIDKIKIYCEELHNYFYKRYGISIESVDFDKKQNVILLIEHLTGKINLSALEKKILSEIKHLNDIEVRNMKIILTFDCKEIELC